MGLFFRLSRNHRLSIEIILSTIFANVLALAAPLFVIQVLNRYVSFGVDSTLITLSLGVLIAIVLEFCFRMLRSWGAKKINVPVDREISQKVFSALSVCRLNSIEKLPIGLRQQLLKDIETVKQAYSSNNIAILLDLPFVLLFLFVVALISVVLFFVGLFGAVILFILGIYGLFHSKKIMPEIVAVNVSRGAVANSMVNEPSTIRSFNAAKYVNSLWNKFLGVLEGLQYRLETQQHLVTNLTQAVTAITTVLVIAIGAKLVVEGDLNVGTLIGANILVARALMPIAKFNSIIGLLIQAKQASVRLMQIERIPLELQEGSMLKKYSGRVTFKDMAFAYETSPSPLFESLDLEITPGMFIAVTGPNGSGKTTLARLLMGLLPPTRGHLMIDGVDLRQVVTQWWRQQVSYLPQEPVFFDGSIRENIMMTNPKLPVAALNEIIKRVDLRTYLDQTQNGLDDLIDNRGQNLAVGIRRRIALARALSTEGELIVFDEPIESLDPEGQEAVQSIIEHLNAQKKTLIITTYDPAILNKADYVIDLGSKPTPQITQVGSSYV